MPQTNLELTQHHHDSHTADTSSTCPRKQKAAGTTKTIEYHIKILSLYSMKIVSPSSTKNKKSVL